MWRFSRVMSWRTNKFYWTMHEGTTYHKTEGIIRLAIKELLSKVSRLRHKRDECAINHAVTGSPSMTRDTLHPVRCFSLLICIGPSNGLVMEQQEALRKVNVCKYPDIWRIVSIILPLGWFIMQSFIPPFLRIPLKGGLLHLSSIYGDFWVGL